MAATKRPNIVDSSAWLEYFADGRGAASFATAIEAVDRLIVPSICLVECSRSSFGSAARVMPSRRSR